MYSFVVRKIASSRLRKSFEIRVIGSSDVDECKYDSYSSEGPNKSGVEVGNAV